MAGADFIVGLEVQPRGAGLQQAAAQTKVLTDETRKSGEETRRYKSSLTELEQAQRRQKSTTEDIARAIRAQNLALAQAKTDIAQYQQKVEQAAEAKRRATGVFNTFRAAVVAVQIAVAALGLGALVRDAVGVALAFDRAGKSLVAATGSTAGSAREMAFVTAEADRLGLVLTDTAQAYAKLSAASRGTALAGQQTREIFSAIAETGSVLGLRADEMQGALNAIQQMMSKGTVQAEELRGQLGERLPGAFQIAARAMGVTTAQLGKMLEGGKVMAADLLPKLAEELRKTFGSGLVNAVNSAQANLNRFRNAVDQVKRALGEGFLSGFLAGFADLKKDLSAEELKAAARDLGENIGKALRTAADAAMFLAKNLELVKAVLIVILSLKVAAFFVSIAGAIATATGATLTFKSALSSLAIAGPLAAIGIALLAAIVIMEKYIMTTRLAMQAELERVAKSQEVFGYYQTLKANKVGLTEAEAAYAIEVRKTMEAELASLRVSVAKTEAQLRAANTRNPFKYAQVAGPGRNALREQSIEGSREIKTLENQLNILDSQWKRLGKLPVIKLPVDPGDVDKAAKKLADLLAGFQRAAEQAEQIRDEQRANGASGAARAAAEIERENAAYQALHSMEGLSAAAKAKLTAVIEGLVGRTQAATRATAEDAAETQRSLAFTTAASEAEARLTDAKYQTTVASREFAIQAEAEAIARENLKEGDAEYVAGLIVVLRTRHDYLDSVAQQIAAIERETAHIATLRQKQAELADSQAQDTAATRRLTVELEAETEARARGVQIGSIWYQLLLAIAAARAQEVAVLDQQAAAQARLNEAQAAQRQARAEFTDWNRQREAAKAYGSEIAGILQSYGLLSEASRDLAIHEQALAISREAGNTRTIEQIEEELRGYAAIEMSLARVAAAIELQAYVIQPGIDALHQMGQTLQTEVLDRLFEGNLDFEDLWKSMARMFAQALVEMLKRWILTHRAMQAEAMRTAAINAAAGGSGGNSGGGTGAMGSLFSMGRQYMSMTGSGAAAGSGTAATSGMSGWMASYGAAIGWTVAIYAAIYLGVSQYIDTHKKNLHAVSFKLNSDVGALVTMIDGASDRNGAMTKQVQDMGKQVVDWLKSLGGTIDGIGQEMVTISSKGRGGNKKWFVEIAGGVKEWFASQEEAFSFAMVQALRAAEIKGLDPIVSAAIRRSTAKSMEELQQGIADAVKVASFGKAEASGDFRAVTAEMDRLRVSMRALLGPGEELSDALARINEQEILLLQSQRDAITGHQRTAAEDKAIKVLEMQAWNAERALRIANVAVMIIEQKARIENYKGSQRLIGAGGAGGGSAGGNGGGLLGVSRAFMFAAYAADVAAVAIAGTGDVTLDALNAQLAALEGLQAALNALPPIDPSELGQGGNRRGGGGGSDRKEGRESLADEVARWRLTDVGSALRDATQWFQDFRERLKDLGYSAAKQAELMGLAAEELARRQAAIKQTQLAASVDFINAGTAQGGSLLQGLTENTRTQDALIQANRDLWRGGQLSLREMRALNNAIRAAGEGQREQMVTGAGNQLLLDLYQLLGNEKEAAQLRFDLTLAELDIRRAELAIAIETLGWEQARRDTILGTVDSLIAKVREIGPAIFQGAGGAGGGSTTTRQGPAGYRDANGVFHWTDLEGAANDNATAKADEARRLQQSYRDAGRNQYERQRRQIVADFEMMRAALGDNAENAALFTAALGRLKTEFLGGVQEFYDSLLAGEASGLNTEQRYSAAMGKYNQLLSAVQAGDLSQADALRASGEELTRLAGMMWGTSTGGFAEVRQRILGDLARLLEIPGAEQSSSAASSFYAPSGSAGQETPTTAIRESGDLQVRATQEVGDVVDILGRRLGGILTRIADTLDRMDERERTNETAQVPPASYGTGS